MDKNDKNEGKLFYSLCLPTKPIKKADNYSAHTKKIKYEKVKYKYFTYIKLKYEILFFYYNKVYNNLIFIYY